MAFDATSPFALACLGDNMKSGQSLRTLGQEKPAEEREQDLLALATSWNVDMTEREAHDVVSEYDLVVAAPGVRHNLSAASASASASASISISIS
jgi:UDP-N-acetylmuramoylalanine-D-glutamate ligase